MELAKLADENFGRIRKKVLKFCMMLTKTYASGSEAILRKRKRRRKQRIPENQGQTERKTMNRRHTSCLSFETSKNQSICIGMKKREIKTIEGCIGTPSIPIPTIRQETRLNLRANQCSIFKGT
ncbi:hypothetical protein SLE2022_348720 [Rubroshorea leprosula]